MRTIILTLLSCVSAVYGQNTISLSPSTVFLNATLNAGPVSVNVAVTSNPGTVGIAVAPPTVPWLTVTQGTANTPTSLKVTGNPAGLVAAVYSTLVTVNTPSGTAPLEVVMTVNPPSSLVPSPSGLIVNFVQGSGTPPTAQTFNLASSSPSAFTVTGTSKWLLFSTNGFTAPGAPGTVTVNVDPTQLGGPGVYIAGVTVNPASGLPSITIPVVFYYQTSPTLTVAPAALAFNFQPFAPNNIMQRTLNVTSGGTPVSFAASTSVTTLGPSWLAVAPTQGATPGTLTVSAVQPGALPTGQYQGTVTIRSPGASNPNLTIPVTLTVSDLPLLDLNILNLSFTYQVGGVLPADQFIAPTSTTPNLAYTIATSTNNTGNWLMATSSGATPAQVDVNVNPVGLPLGTYMGTLTFNAPNGGNNPQVVNVTLNVVNNPTLLTTPTSATGLVFNFETGGSAPGSQTVQVTSSGAALGFGLGVAQNSTSNNVNWLQVGTPNATTTPATFTVAVNTTGMAPGQYTGTIIITTPGGGMQVTLSVVLNVTAAGTALLFTNPQTLAFNMLAGGTAANQQVSVNTTGESVSYNATPGPTTPAGGTWLTVGPPSGAASATNISNFFVGLNAAMLAPGIYKGSVIVAPGNGTPSVIIPVTLTVTTGNLAASAASLTFAQASFGPAPPPQNLTITSTGAVLPITVATTGGNWFAVSPQNANTPATLAVAVNAGSLQPGSYTGQINIISAGAGNSPLAVPVNLTVTTAQSLNLAVAGGGSSLSFTAQTGSAAPPAQTVALTASGGSLPFVTNINITSPAGGNWLAVTPTSGTATSTPTTLSISANPQGLNPGTYNGSVSISSPTANNSPQTIPVTFTVQTAPPTPAPTPTSVVNGGSLQTGAVSAGEIITIHGTNMGPAAGVAGTAGPDNQQPTLVSDTWVTFDNVPAPLVFVSANQIDAVVPYEVDGQTQTRMIVTYKGVAANALVLKVAASAPGLFLGTASSAAPTQAKVLNSDGSPNSPDNPAAKETEIVLFATGEGQTMPAGVTGLVIPADGSAVKMPVLPVTVTIGGEQAEIRYAGSLPGFVSGFMQINVVVPDTAPSGATVPVVLTVGANSSSGGTTLAVQ